MIDRRALLCTALVLLAVMQTACMEMLRSEKYIASIASPLLAG